MRKLIDFLLGPPITQKQQEQLVAALENARTYAISRGIIYF